MKSEERTKRYAQEILHILETHYEEFDTDLGYDEEWQLLIAVMLSAQTTDTNVNNVTPKLFATLRTIEEIAAAPLVQMEELIYSTGYYKNKARNLKAMATELIRRFDGRVPDSMEALTSLPGVGRKTANVVLHVLHKNVEGIVMDTHVSRVTHRLGFTIRKHPAHAETIMMTLLPRKDWKRWGDYLIQHGRAICHARNPACSRCPLRTLCPSRQD